MSLRLITLLAFSAVILSGCGERDYSKFTSTLVSYEEAAVSGDDVVGTFPLTHINTTAVPTDYVFADGCTIRITGGQLELTADAAYSLALQTETVCNDEVSDTGEIRRDGLFQLLGHELRFGDRMLPYNDETAPEVHAGDEELGDLLLPDGRFYAQGTIRYDRISATISDFHTFVFARD